MFYASRSGRLSASRLRLSLRTARSSVRIALGQPVRSEGAKRRPDFRRAQAAPHADGGRAFTPHDPDPGRFNTADARTNCAGAVWP